MIFYLLSLLVLCAFGMKFSVRGFHNDYLSRDVTNSVKGLFIGLVFISHLNQYVASCGYDYCCFGDGVFRIAKTWTGQLMVVMFLFYSGFGVMTSIKTKGRSYIDAMPRHRVLTTLLNFDVAVLVFIVLNIALGRAVDVRQALLSLTAWDSVGNSNWYIFVVIACYALAYLSFRWTKGFYGVVLNVALIGMAMFGLSYVRPVWWYDTIFAFAAGLVFAAYREKFERFFKDHYALSLIALVVLFSLLKDEPVHCKGLLPNGAAVCFAFIVVLMTMKVKIGNTILIWAGLHLFPLYIYQRIPMIALSNYGGGVLVRDYLPCYILACLGVTVLMAFGYRIIEVRLNG